MLNFLVETKNEYTTHLNNILTPLIFEGISSIYKEAQEIAGPDNVLKIFQTFLKRIPKWNQVIIEKETNRIINSSQSYGWLGDLIKATLKANLVILIYNPTIKTQTKFDNSFYQNINVNDFIHKVYIECAREIWNNPYLLYHNYPPIEIKRNQRDCINIIKDCVKEAIRKLLPVKHILQIYLGEEMELNNINNDDDFEKIMTDAEEKNLTNLIKKDLAKNEVLEINYSGSDANQKFVKQMQNQKTVKTIQPIQIPIQIPIESIQQIQQMQNSIQIPIEPMQTPIQIEPIQKPIQIEPIQKQIELMQNPIQKQIELMQKQIEPMQKQIEPIQMQKQIEPMQKQMQKQIEPMQMQMQIEPMQIQMQKQIELKPIQNNESTDEKTIGSRILQIINNNSLSTSDVASLLSSNKNNSDTNTKNKNTQGKKSESDTSESMADLKQSIKNLEDSLKPNNDSNKKNLESIDEKIKKIIKKDLANDSDLETSLNYSQEDNDNKYQEIFSNSNVQIKQKQEKTDVKNLKDKKKFFNNYMQF